MAQHPRQSGGSFQWGRNWSPDGKSTTIFSQVGGEPLPRIDHSASGDAMATFPPTSSTYRLIEAGYALARECDGFGYIPRFQEQFFDMGAILCIPLVSIEDPEDGEDEDE